MRNLEWRFWLALVLAIGARARAADFPLPELISRFDQPAQAAPAGISASPELSSDGRFLLFHSTASGLAGPVRDHRFFNLYLRDRQAAATRLVSVNETLTGGANAHTLNASVSADGRFVVFESKATNLAATARTGKSDIFLRDLQENTTRHVSAPNRALGNLPHNHSESPDISSDGQKIVYTTTGSDIAAAPFGTARLFILHDTATAQNRAIVSQNLGAAASFVRTYNPQFSGDAATVAFEATGTNFVTREPTYGRHIYAYPFATQEPYMVSAYVMTLLGRPANTRGDSFVRGVSDDGKSVLFVTTGVPAISGGATTNYLFLDNFALDTTRILATNMVTSADSLALTPDGRFAVFSVNGNVWRYDWQSEARELVSARLDGTPLANSPNPTQITISADARFITFLSDAAGLTAESEAGVSRLYRRDMQTSETIALTPAFRGQIYETTASADGNLLAFSSDDPSLIPGDNNGAIDVFLWDPTVDAMTPFSLVSHLDPTLSPTGAFRMLSISDKPASADANFVVFSGIPANTAGFPQVYLRDRAAQTTILVSRNSTDSTASSGNACKPMISADGRWIAYETTSTNIVAGINDTNNTTDVILFDRQTQTSRQVTKNVAGEGTARDPSSLEAMSPDGRYLIVNSANVTFVNPAVTRFGVTGAGALYLWDRESGLFTLLTRNPGGSAYLAAHYAIEFSPDSQRAAFVGIGPLAFEHAYTGRATNHVSNFSAALLVVETLTGRLRGIPATTVAGPQRALTFSPEGSKLVTTALPSNSSRSLSVIDLQTWAIADFAFPELRPTQISAAFDAAAVAYRLVTTTSGALGILNLGAMATNRISFPGDTRAEDVAITPNGISLFFQTPAATETDSNTFPDLYRVDAQTLDTILVTRAASTEFAANGPSVARQLSRDGTTLLFISGASDLIGTDYNALADLYASPIASPLPGAPIIARGPSPQSIFPGETAIFHVVAAPSAEPISYQWFRGPTAIDGATSATLLIPNAAENDSALFHVELRNASGRTLSEPVALQVALPTLQYGLIDPDTIVLSWPAPSGGYLLEASLLLGGDANWIVQQNQGLPNNGRFNATFGLVGSQIYFRMRKP